MSEPETDPAASPAATPPSRAGSRPLPAALWALAGAALTLLVMIAVRPGERPHPGPSPPPGASPRPPPAQADPDARRSSRAEFAELYSSYLLKTYYVPSRGFCPALLRRVCLALRHADLLADARHCESVPNDELVLAIGRYQNRVGLPVDGKAGPETVRMMLGGDFSNRKGMEQAYCTPASPAPSDAGPSAVAPTSP